MIPLLLKYWQGGVAVVAILGFVAMCHARDTALTERGEARERARAADSVSRERARAADSVLRVTAGRLARVDTLLVRDTVTVRRTIARVDSLRDTLLVRLTDTLVVKEFIARTDSALQACSALAGDCAAFRSIAQQRFAAYEARIAAMPALQAKSCVVPSLVTGVLGAAAGWLVKR